VIYLLAGAALLALLVWAGRRPVLKRREWRLLSAAFAIAAFVGAAWSGMRGAWEPALVLGALGLWLAGSARLWGTKPSAPPRQARRDMSLSEARSILGVGQDATKAEIQAAYSRLMRMAHPDKGGTDGLAAQLNAARDRLIRG